jgi:hypothetical protein
MLDMSIPIAKCRWKIQTWNRNPTEPKALYVPYFDARDVADRLDDLFGWDGWSDSIEFIDVKGTAAAVCRLTVHGESRDVTKVDCAPLTDIESIKGGASDAFKRAAAKLGVGRNAYDLPTVWASCDLKGEGDRAQPVMPKGHEEKLTRQAIARAGKSGGETRKEG